MTQQAQPTLTTERLILRPFTLADAKDVQRLAGHPLIYATTASIPHPYPDGAAEEWIGLHQKWFDNGETAQFAVVDKKSRALVGNVSVFGISKQHERGELGYWIAVDEWGKGYATEASRALLEYAFKAFNLQKITARFISTNPTSGRVMEKLGMSREGVFRRDAKKDGVFHDVVYYGILREEF